MIKKSIKYLSIILINLIILTGLLAYWTDSIELTFNGWVRQVEFLKILGISLLSLVAIRIAIEFFKKQNTGRRSRIMISALLTILISSVLYFTYSKKVYQNRILNGELRNKLIKKIELTNELAFGTKAKNLTYKEYEVLSKVKWFPTLQENADSISYHYTYDGFLPDYSFEVSYMIPIGIEIDSTVFKHGKIEIDTIGDKKRVNYNEFVE